MSGLPSASSSKASSLQDRWSTALMSILPGAAVLIFLSRVAFYYWPYPWPDEALFSSPAAALASGRGFTTPVLEGLIPGMDRATLWNGPLFPVLLSGVYSLTGESLVAGRLLSLGFAVASLFVVYRITGHIIRDIRFRIITVTILAFDPVFLRSANIIRMDMASLFFVLLVLDLFMRGNLRRNARSSFGQGKEYPYAGAIRGPVRGDLDSHEVWSYLAAGVATGLAGMTHPFAVILVPLWLIWVLPDIRKILIGFLGGVLGFLPWAIYIAMYPGIFRTQFAAQLGRKPEMFSLWGGDTGGALKVFFSQYGGGAISMIGFALVLALVLAASTVYMVRLLRDYNSGMESRGRYRFFLRLYLGTLVVIAMIVYSTEGWYALYAGPFLLLTGLSASAHRVPGETNLEKKTYGPVFAILALFFVVSTVLLVYRNEQLYASPNAVKGRQKAIIEITNKCNAIYLRSVPDPYFALKRNYPQKRILEFIPGKLDFEGLSTTRLHETYNSIDCFLLNPHHDWEPVLQDYLRRRRSEFEKLSIISPTPIEEHTLWVRKKD